MKMSGKGNFANFYAFMFRCRLFQIFLAQYTIEYGSAFTPQRVHHFVVLGQFAWLTEEAIVEILAADSGQFVGRCTENCSTCRLLLREMVGLKRLPVVNLIPIGLSCIIGIAGGIFSRRAGER